MTRVEQAVTPMYRVLAVLLTFALGGVVAVALWNWWSGRCGEACPSSNVVHMLVFLGLLPTASTMTAVLLVSTSWPRGVKLGIVVVALIAAVVVGALVAQVPAA